MIRPRDLVVFFVDLIAYPMGKAIDRIDFTNLTEDDE